MQSTAQKLYPEQAMIPALKVVEQPLYLVGTQVRAYAGGQSWEAFNADTRALYSCDGRWCGGRFIAWTLEVDGPGGLTKKRGGYFDTVTGIFHYGGKGTA